MGGRARDLRVKAQRYLSKIIDCDPYLNHIDREVLELTIQSLESAGNLEKAVLKKAERLQAQDRERFSRLNIDPELLPDLFSYISIRGTL